MKLFHGLLVVTWLSQIVAAPLEIAAKFGESKELQVRKFDSSLVNRGYLSSLKVLPVILNDIPEVKSAENDEDDWTSDAIDKLLVKVFRALKNSGLVNDIVKMALTDDEVRPAVADITIELVRADVIPYEEVFVALKDSGLATDVIRNLLLDPETREGTVELIKELLPPATAAKVPAIKLANATTIVSKSPTAY